MLPWVGHVGLEQIVEGCASLVKDCKLSSGGAGGEKSTRNPSQFPFLAPVSILRRNCLFIWLFGALCTCTVGYTCVKYYGCSTEVLFITKPTVTRWILIVLQITRTFLSAASLWATDRKFSACKSSCDHVGPTQIIQDNLTICHLMNNLMIMTSIKFLWHITYNSHSLDTTGWRL